MANEIIKDAIEPIESEPIQTVETEESATSENPESTSTETTVDVNKTVTTLSEAKEVLKAQKAQKESTVKEQSRKSSTEKLDYKKQFEEIQKLAGKQGNELSELRKFQKESASMVTAWKEQQAKNEQLELQKRIQENPQQAYAEIARKEAQQLIAPMQEQYTALQAKDINSQIQDMTKEQYSVLAPIMSEALEFFEKIDAQNANDPDPAKRTNLAQDLASKPQILIELATQEHAKRTTSQSIETSKQKQANNIKIASGVAKNTNTKASSPENFSNLTLQEMTQQMKSMGILKR